jgi:glycosyltransferase involved in cell wall biosynthesis
VRIGIDGRVFLGSKTGISHYVSELCKALGKVLPDARFFIYSRDPVLLPVHGSQWMLRTESSLLRKKLKTFLWHKFVSGFLCRGDKIDVYWGAGSSLPFFLDQTATVLTVYDMVYMIAPETMYKFNLLLFRLFFRRDTLHATKITTISRGTSTRLQDMLGCESAAVIYPSADESFVPQAEASVRYCLRKYELAKPYFLSVATWEPRKNLRLLLETFLRMKAKGELVNHQLVLAGGHGWKNDKIAGIIADNTGNSGIVPLGYVDREDLAPLYSGAAALLFPSKYEGFGMPVLEARKCGTRVITSDTPELREAGGSESIYIEPTREGIRDGIQRCLHNEFPPSSEETVGPGWEEGAEKMVRVFCAAVDDFSAQYSR